MGANGGNHGIFGKAAVHVNAEQLQVRADVLLSVQALIASAAGNMRFAGDLLPRPESGDTGANRHDIAATFMSHNRRQNNAGILGPGIPFKDMNIRTAKSRRFHADQYLARPAFRNRHAGQFGQVGRFFDDCRHLVHRDTPPRSLYS